MLDKKINQINDIYKKNYEEDTSISLNDFLNILYDTDIFYIINTPFKIDINWIDDKDNFLPEHGLLSLEFNKIIEFINKIDEKKYHTNDKHFIDRIQNEMSEDIFESINKIIFSIIHGIDFEQFKFSYEKNDLNEILLFTFLMNKIYNVLEISDYTLFKIYSDKLNIDENIMFSTFLERLGQSQNPYNIINKKDDEFNKEENRIKKIMNAFLFKNKNNTFNYNKTNLIIENYQKNEKTEKASFLQNIPKDFPKIEKNIYQDMKLQ